MSFQSPHLITFSKPPDFFALVLPTKESSSERERERERERDLDLKVGLRKRDD
jgi:hypothetical protein